MLAELRVSNLGAIEDARLDLGPGMTALTGETGAGKTLLVGALTLLLGARGDPLAVRSGAPEAVVQGRFVEEGGEETVVSRTLPASGRSRAEVNAKMVSVGALGGLLGGLVDVYGQHAHQSLLDPSAQRRALDLFAGVDLSELGRARERLRSIDAELEALGGGARERSRAMEVIAHEIAEIDRAALADDDEEERLAEERDRLADAVAYREAAAGALAALQGPDSGAAGSAGGLPGALDLLGAARGALAGRSGLARWAERLAGAEGELADVASELRRVLEAWEDDPQREDEVRARLVLLRDLRRRYGDTLAEVRAYAEDARLRLEEMRGSEARAELLAAERDELAVLARRLEAEILRGRSEAAPRLAAAVEERLRELAMPGARLEVEVGDEAPGDAVTFLLAANPGEPALPLAKVASGGELSRAMLALRLVLAGAPPTAVFDEVDAGIGGEAAVTVGRALKELSRGRQVLVVTHLAQVAAFADQHFAVEKHEHGGRARSVVRGLHPEERTVELARMLAGQPGSRAAREHAEELLRLAAG